MELFIYYVVIPNIVWAISWVIAVSLRKDISEWVRYLILVKTFKKYKRCPGCNDVINKRVIICPTCNYTHPFNKMLNERLREARKTTDYDKQKRSEMCERDSVFKQLLPRLKSGETAFCKSCGLMLHIEKRPYHCICGTKSTAFKNGTIKAIKYIDRLKSREKRRVPIKDVSFGQVRWNGKDYYFNRRGLTRALEDMSKKGEGNEN